MNILDLTTTEAVRALIGIDAASQELPDQLFIDLEIEDALLLELSDWLTSPISEVIAGADGSGDAADRAYLALRGAAKAWCAMAVLQAGEISIAQRHQDASNQFARQTFKMDDVLLRLSALYARYKGLCLAGLGELVISSTSWMAGASVPSYDPVTNTTA
jgi:hypothetical protein